MARIQKFEDLEAWKKAREMTKAIYLVTSTGEFFKDFGLRDQVRRAGVSAMSNIAEGFERGSNAEFIQFLYISKGSAGETRTQIYIALDQEYITKDEFRNGCELSRDVSGQLSGLIEYLKGSRLKGEKFKKEHKSMREEVQDITRQFKIQDSKNTTEFQF